MEELQIKISQEPAVIRCNFEDVKAQLSAKMAEYQGAVFTEESKSVAKAEMALNSLGIYFERRQA